MINIKVGEKSALTLFGKVSSAFGKAGETFSRSAFSQTTTAKFHRDTFTGQRKHLSATAPNANAKAETA